MKTALAALLALGLATGAVNARTVFDDIRDTAPRSDIFADIQKTAPRTIFDDIRDTAPRSLFDQIRDSAPRSDGVFGDLERNAP
ncbi:MAG: hypothetical protein ACKVP7_10625 [Hyphomicrobiaceae bacterium]